MPWLGPNRSLTRAPAWLMAMTPKTWTTVAASGISVCDPNADPTANVVNWPSNGTWTATQSGSPLSFQGPVMGAWNGAAVVGTQLVMGANGGHGDYYGNEVYALQLNAASPVWRRVSNPSDIASLGGTGDDTTNGAGNYGDGRPRATHTYYRPIGTPNGRYWLPGLDAMAKSTGDSTTASYYFDLNTGTWSALGVQLAADSGSLVFKTGPSIYDPIGNKVYTVAGSGDGTTQNMLMVDPDTATITKYTNSNSAGGGWGVCIWDTNPRYFAYAGCALGTMRLLDLSNPSGSWSSAVTTSGSPARFPSGGSVTGGPSAVYHAPSRAILCWQNDGANIIKLARPTDPVGGTWTWSTVSPDGSNAVTPSTAQSNGTFGRFNLMTIGGIDVLVIVNDYNGPTYVYRLPENGV